MEQYPNEPLTESDELIPNDENGDSSKPGWLKKVSKSEFGKRVLTKRVALVLAVLVVAGILVNLTPAFSDNGYEGLISFFEVFTRPDFLLYVLIGLVAQMVDGALGMAYGASSNTMLLSAGVPVGIASRSIKISEVFTTAASGFSHWKMGNVNKKLVMNLIIPGVVGAIAGSLLLVYFGHLEKVSKTYLRPAIAVYILALGVYLIFKAIDGVKKKKKTKRLRFLAVTGGFFDAIGGGGWGPIVTSTLLSRGRNPKYTIGSVNLAEFFVALAGAVTLSWAIKSDGLDVVLGLIIGGIIAAPFGAKVAQKVKTKPLMILVGSLIIIVNLYNIYKWYKSILVVIILGVAVSAAVIIMLRGKKILDKRAAAKV